MTVTKQPLVSTIAERCRMCYTCVRECPVKAIRVEDGQAQVLGERCIACGNCVQVCSQHAKAVADGRREVAALLANGNPVAACIAPSFPAEFTECEPEQLVGMLRALGFARVTEVAFGADLVARAYRELLDREPDRRFIATTCPAIVGYVERYAPDLLSNLAPIVSPMVAAARVVKAMHGRDTRVVFIGPCIAKKGEWEGEEIDAVLTFRELRELLAVRGLDPGHVTPTNFDPPFSGAGRLFSIGGGMLQAAQLKEDLMSGEVVQAEGRPAFVEALKEFESGDLDARLLEVLCCNGCIMGPGTSQKTPLFRRRAKVSHYVRERMPRLDEARWSEQVRKYLPLALQRGYHANDQRIAPPSEKKLREILASLGKNCVADELNCGACGYDTCRNHAIAIAKGLAEPEMCLPHAVERLSKTYQELADSHTRLAETQEQLVHAEKMASMGQLAAGIAHEVNNPLSTVLMLSHLLLEEAENGSDSREDLSMIAAEADRCKKIVAGLLQFARQNRVDARARDLEELAQRTIRNTQLPVGVEAEVLAEHDDLRAEVDGDQLLQVFSNLVNNAIGAMPNGGKLTVRLGGDAENVWFRVSDTGTGISPEHQKKIFEPFFTTKAAGKGTGLGLAVTFGVIKMHRGDIRVESNCDPRAGDTGTTFIITLPRRRKDA